MTLAHAFAQDASFLATDVVSAVPSLERDLAIEAAVRGMLEALPSNELTHVTVSARDNVVRLDGTVTDGRWLARFKNKVTGALPSVRIDDRLDWIVPDCGIAYA